MSDRDELIELIDGLQDVGRSRAYMIADAILSAGWRAPEGCICAEAERTRTSAWQCTEHGWMQWIEPLHRRMTLDDIPPGI